MGIFITVDGSGISGMSFGQVLAWYQDQYRSIYGQDIYIEPDSQDGQWIGIQALAVKDLIDAAIAVYNDFSPATAQGAGLSSVVKVNGIRKHIATNSSVVVTLVGQAGTVITNGQVRDNQNLGSVWQLPATVTIPVSGQIDVTAISTVAGAVSVGPGEITEIVTPFPGWQTVTNALAAVPGAPVETDAQLRTRQSRSVGQPSITSLGGIVGAVGDLLGVVRVVGYQNETNIDNPVTGLPARSIAIVVQGGNVVTVAQTIALKKPPGVPTYGTTNEMILDASGVPNSIQLSFEVPVTLKTLVFLRPLTGYVTSTTDLIRTAISSFISGLDIGEPSYLGRLFSPANLEGDEAQGATGLNATQLNTISSTYHVTPLALAQARSDMIVTDGPHGTGSTSMALARTVDFHIGDVIYIVLADLSYFRTIVTGVTGLTVTFSPGVPGGGTINNGALVYLIDDVAANFNEGFLAATTDVVAINANNNTLL
jgi:uncharacterized phage protein gp47/JayE